jgi:hypothetical protein
MDSAAQWRAASAWSRTFPHILLESSRVTLPVGPLAAGVGHLLDAKDTWQRLKRRHPKIAEQERDLMGILGRSW